MKKKIADRKLIQTIEETFEALEEINLSKVNWTVRERSVFLSGLVDSEHDRATLFLLCENISGVEDVFSQLQIVGFGSNFPSSSNEFTFYIPSPS